MRIGWTQPPPLDQYEPAWRLVRPDRADGALDVPAWQDLLVMRLEHETRLSYSLIIPMERVPDTLSLPAALNPPPNWKLEAAGSWSTETVALALQAWLWDHTDRDDLRVDTPEAAHATFEIAPGVRAEDGAIDALWQSGDLGIEASRYLTELAEGLRA